MTIWFHTLVTQDTTQRHKDTSFNLIWESKWRNRLMVTTISLFMWMTHEPTKLLSRILDRSRSTSTRDRKKELILACVMTISFTRRSQTISRQSPRIQVQCSHLPSLVWSFSCSPSSSSSFSQMAPIWAICHSSVYYSSLTLLSFYSSLFSSGLAILDHSS